MDSEFGRDSVGGADAGEKVRMVVVIDGELARRFDAQAGGWGRRSEEVRRLMEAYALDPLVMEEARVRVLREARQTGAAVAA